MTGTVLESPRMKVTIGSDHPFVMIGERINPTWRPRLAQAMTRGDFAPVIEEALAQSRAGAAMLDVNAGIPGADEPRVLADCIRNLQDHVDVPLAIDTSSVAALEAALAVYRGKALVNSVTGEEDRLERVLPLVRKHGAAVIAICNDETGISEDPDKRFAVARKIVARAADHGVPASDVIVDPLVMPAGAVAGAGANVLRLLRLLREDLRVNTTCGASNFSLGLPNRRGLNTVFIPMMIGAGLTSAIMNPLHVEDMQAILAADLVMGRDPDCARWSAAFRAPPLRR